MASLAAQMFPRRPGRWLTDRLKICEDCLNVERLKGRISRSVPLDFLNRDANLQIRDGSRIITGLFGCDRGDLEPDSRAERTYHKRKTRP
jgi:hypothetical protein